MNAYQRQILERKATDLVRFSNRSGSHMDTCLRFGTNETLAHLHKKLEIMLELRKQGHHVLSEAIFLNQSRADILDTSDFGKDRIATAYEIMNSEKEESIERKEQAYPEGVRIIKIKV